MAFREVDVVEVREVLRGWLDGAGLRTVAERAGVDRKTARRYVQAAEAAGLSRDAGLAAVSDELIGAVVAAVRPVRPSGHGVAWDLLMERKPEIAGWVKDGLTIVKIEVLLTRSGTTVPYRTLHRFAAEECGFRPRDTTVRVLDGDPGVECQIDFAQMGFIDDPDTERRRKVHALIFTAVFSRHLFVHLTYSQTLAEVIAGCEAAWSFFGGVFKVLIPDNLKPVVTAADAVNPRLSVGWLDYSQHAGFVTDPARVRTPQDKPMVERAVQYVRNNFFAGERFTDLQQAQAAATVWCTRTAGMRIHGSTAARPLEVFGRAGTGCAATGPAALRRPGAAVGEGPPGLPRRDRQRPVFGSGAVHRRDPGRPRRPSTGQTVPPRPTHQSPPQAAARRPVDRPGRPARGAGRLRNAGPGPPDRHRRRHGHNVGIYAARLLDDPLPWTRMRAVYRLLGLVRRYGAGPVDTACGTALDLDVVSVAKIDSMLAKALEAAAPALPAAAGHPAGRFGRDPAEYRRTAPALTLVPDPPEQGSTP